MASDVLKNHLELLSLPYETSLELSIKLQECLAKLFYSSRVDPQHFSSPSDLSPIIQNLLMKIKSYQENSDRSLKSDKDYETKSAEKDLDEFQQDSEPEIKYKDEIDNEIQTEIEMKRESSLPGEASREKSGEKVPVETHFENSLDFISGDNESPGKDGNKGNRYDDVDLEEDNYTQSYKNKVEQPPNSLGTKKSEPPSEVFINDEDSSLAPKNSLKKKDFSSGRNLPNSYESQEDAVDLLEPVEPQHKPIMKKKNQEKPTKLKPPQAPEAGASPKSLKTPLVESPKPELTSEKLKQFKIEQAQREKAYAKELERVNQKILEERQREIDQQLKEKQIKEEEYKQEIERMKEKKLKRQQELEQIKKRQHDLEQIQSSKPLYKKIEENFVQELQTSEKVKQTVKKAHSPVNQLEIEEHARWYDEQKREHQRRSEKELKEKVRASSYGLTSGWTTRVLEDDKRLKNELNRASQERLNMIERKTKYAELVKEMFLPTVNRLKKQEAESSPKYRPRYKSSNNRSDKRGLASDNEEREKNVQKRPKKFKENPMLPKAPAKKQPKVVDFLEEQRRLRQEMDIEQSDPMDWEKEIDADLPQKDLEKMLKKKAKQLESKARKQELLIDSSSPTSAKALKQSASVNELLLNSIKAKLAALDNKIN